MLTVLLAFCALLNVWAFFKACGSIARLETVSSAGKRDMVGWNLLDLFISLAALGFFLINYVAAGFIALAAMIALFLTMPYIMRDIFARHAVNGEA